MNGLDGALYLQHFLKMVLRCRSDVLYEPKPLPQVRRPNLLWGEVNRANPFLLRACISRRSMSGLHHSWYCEQITAACCSMRRARSGFASMMSLQGLVESDAYRVSGSVALDTLCCQPGSRAGISMCASTISILVASFESINSRN